MLHVMVILMNDNGEIRILQDFFFEFRLTNERYHNVGEMIRLIKILPNSTQPFLTIGR